MAIFLIIIAIIVFFVAYVTYGSWLAKKWGVDPSKKTPANEMYDGVDYVPASSGVVIGHHFASIAGAGPIIGPIAAGIFGWLPVYLWIIIGSIFFGGVHDFGSLFASIRHKGKSISKIIADNMGTSGKKLFSLFAWLTLILVEAAFVAIVANTFVSIPAVATTSLLFIIVAVLFGIATNRLGVNGKIATVIGVFGIFASIYVGLKLPIILPFETWVVIILAYIFIASVTPVWILLQPRDYLNSYLLYAMLLGAIVGLILYNPDMVTPAFNGLKVVNASGTQYLFPILFVTVACGAISGFHSLVGSGTTAKQINSEKDIKLVGYGAMLIEGVLAVIALITISYVAVGTFEPGTAPAVIFSQGVGTFMSKFGLDYDTGVTFVSLAVSAFALTSLDTATRLGRFIFQEYFEKENIEKSKQSILTNKYVATFITVVLGGLLCVNGWKNIWPIFGSANQLLAALALLAIGVWLKKSGKNSIMVIVPMIFMLLVTLAALGLLLKDNIVKITSGITAEDGLFSAYALSVLSLVLFILAIVFVVYAYSTIKNVKTKKTNE